MNGSSSLLTPDQPSVTVITPTTGRQSLLRLIESVDAERDAASITHLLLWDDKREAGAPDPEGLRSPGRYCLVAPPGFGRFGNAPGSALRSVGLLLATTTWVTFADDDVYWERGHLAALLDASRGRNWASTLRRIWASDSDCLGVDRFESVGDDPGRRVPYEMCDNNCMLVGREWGVAAAPMYRETRAYNDDRLLYAMMKEHAGPRGTTGIATINQVCPAHLVHLFRPHCSPC